MRTSVRRTIPNDGASLRFTLDSNLLVCSVDTVAGHRHDLAVQIVDRALDVDCWLTLQSISEFFAAVTRKRIMPVTEAAAQAREWLSLFPLAAASANGVSAALEDAISGRASYWDALLVATAAEVGCRLLLSEDMSDGARLSGVEIHNPFTPSGALTRRARRLLDL